LTAASDSWVHYSKLNPDGPSAGALIEPERKAVVAYPSLLEKSISRTIAAMRRYRMRLLPVFVLITTFSFLAWMPAAAKSIQLACTITDGLADQSHYVIDMDAKTVIEADEDRAICLGNPRSVCTSKYYESEDTVYWEWEGTNPLNGKRIEKVFFFDTRRLLLNLTKSP
jgi:hypothetical protein